MSVNRMIIQLGASKDLIFSSVRFSSENINGETCGYYLSGRDDNRSIGMLEARLYGWSSNEWDDEYCEFENIERERDGYGLRGTSPAGLKSDVDRYWTDLFYKHLNCGEKGGTEVLE